jgi:hypothetical protein
MKGAAAARRAALFHACKRWKLYEDKPMSRDPGRGGMAKFRLLPVVI